MSEQNYVVTGTRTYRGHAPGSNFTAEPSPELDRAVARGSISEGKPSEALESKSREELNELAVAAGVESPEALPNKQAVVKAIRDNDKE
jgi:hypothetical protein